MKDPSRSQIAPKPPRLPAPMRPRKQPVQDRSRATVEAVLAATLQVLRKQGAAALTTTRVAEVAGVSVGSLYQYFPNKRALVAALKLQYFERITGRTLAAIQAARGLSLTAGVAHIVGELLAAKRDNRLMALALRSSLAELGGRAWVRQAGAVLSDPLTEWLRDAGVTRPDVAARIVVGSIEGVIAAALESDPHALDDPGLGDELVMLACAYLERRRRAC